MNLTAPVKLIRALSLLTVLIIVLVPYHAFLTVWLSTATGHYTLLRLWKEFLLGPIVIGSLYLLTKDKKLALIFWRSRLVRVIFVYLVLLLVCGLAALATHNVTAKAMWYGLLVDARFLILFLAALVISAKDDWLVLNWQKILFVPAILVSAFAVLQYLVLPYDFLKHFGYSEKTIFPYETINHSLARIRVASTLRGANSLGAYLLLPISVLAAFAIKEKRVRLDKLIFGAGLILALIFSFSRSAWLGCLLAAFCISVLSFRSHKAKIYLLRFAAGLLIIAIALTLTLRGNKVFQETFFHTDRSATNVSSNEGHLTAFKSSAADIYHHPLGRGVGAAGPESFYNFGQPARIAEDYFLQIGQEAGIVGMILFITICTAIAKILYTRRSDPLALALFASLIGLSLVNLLSHAWADDTLAYVWWGLAGIALAPILMDKRKQKDGQKTKS